MEKKESKDTNVDGNRKEIGAFICVKRHEIAKMLF